jgi:hypothetical protein
MDKELLDFESMEELLRLSRWFATPVMVRYW